MKKGALKTPNNKFNDFFLNDIKISLTNPENVLEFIEEYDFKKSNYICIFGLYPLFESSNNRELKEALNNSIFNPLHGKFIEFYLRKKGFRNIKTVDGVFLLKNLLNKNISHYFYGASNETLLKMQEKIEIQYKNANVLGYKSPPKIDLSDVKINDLIKRDFTEINLVKPNIVWIGLGGVKQDLVMYNYLKYLDNSLLIGVGAVFDYYAGNLSLSPEFIKKFGLRWFYRIIIQPSIIKRVYKVIIALFKILIKKIFHIFLK